MKRVVVFVLVVLVFVLSWMIDDGTYREHLVGPYYLEIFEEANLISVVRKGTDGGAGGVFEGVVLRVGWSDRYMLADVVKNYRGDIDGLYIVNLMSGECSGPVRESDIAERPELSAIVLRDVRTLY